MNLTDILAFACGSLFATTICLLMHSYAMHKMHRVIHHIRRNSYLRGWRDGNEIAWKADS